MANGHGGYRKPRNPAPVSGPGQLSRRTDGGPSQVNATLSDARYGEQAAFQQIQSGAPMAATVMPRPAPVPLTHPTQRPDEPVTAGAPLGPGPGPGPAQLMQQRSISQVLAMLAENDPSGRIADVAALAARGGY